jgi:two-component system chemotaxis response regulator CheB
MESPSEVIKVLIVDDSSVVRKFISSAIEGCKELQVVGEAANGKEALELLGRLQPDIITLDVEMPVMDGIETLGHIRRKDRKVPIVMFSTLTERGARVTLEALSRGANDYIAKPSSLGGKKNAADLAVEEIRQKLVVHGRLKKGTGVPPGASGKDVPAVPRVTSMGTQTPTSAGTSLPRSTSVLSNDRANTVAAPNAPVSKPHLYTNEPVKLREVRRHTPFKALGIGVSTGGPNAMAEIFKDLRVPFGVPVFITQHMPPVFTKMFAEKLKHVSGLEVFEAVSGQPIRAGEIYVAPGGYHMVINETKDGLTIGLNEDPPENSCRPAVDVMFRSLVKVYGASVLGLVLTGMGSDGLRGAEVIVKAGGEVVAQDEATSAVWGMPGAVAHAGLASSLLPLEAISSELKRKLPIKGREVSS